MARKIDRTSPLFRAFALLERIAGADAPVTLGEATASVALPKPTVYRMLGALHHAGLVAREPGGRRFAVGPRLTRFALDVLRQGWSNAPRRAILQQLAAAIGETCNLTTIEGSEIVYLDRVESAWPLRVTLQPGSRVPLHCTASGKLLLALMPTARRKRLIASMPLARYTDRTIIDTRRFARELIRVRQERLATDNEEFIAGLVCVAVPVALPNGRVVASVAVQAPVARMPLAAAMRHVVVLRRAAIALGTTMNDVASEGLESHAAHRRS